MLFDQVIPRLLRPLGTEGRSIRPVLVHGDLWQGNVATNAETGVPTSFDPAVWWVHNECLFLSQSIPQLAYWSAG